jgi:negative regulator of sigma E activity
MNEMEPSEIEFAQRMKERLDAEIADLDAATLARLRQAREQALEIAAGKQPATWQWWPARFPAQFGLATAALFAVVIWQLQPFPSHDLPVVDMADDLEILIANDEVGFYADMEFLIWLEQQDAG